MAYSLETIKQDLLLTRPGFDDMNLNKVSFSQEMEFLVQAFQNNSYLLQMEANSVKNFLINIALTGISINPILKYAYPVPRKGKLCLDPSYMGLIKILTDTGSVKSIQAKTVFENESFDIELGTNGYIKHKPCFSGPKGKRIGAYSIGVLNDGSNHVEWMYESELMEIRKRSESVKADKATPWKTDEDEMCRKTVVKRHYKYLPKTERAIMAAQAIAFDDENNGIDFKKEQEEANRAKQNPNATPDAPVGEAYATDEDFENLFEILDAGKIGNPFLAKGYENLTVDNLKKQFVKHQEAGTLLKDKFEMYFSWFKWEEQEVDRLAGEEGGEDVTGQTT